MDNSKPRYFTYAWIILGVSFIFKFFYASTFPLVPDETNYWQWSRYLDWGYYDQAPMIAWLIRFFTTFTGQTELGVRLPSISATLITSIYIILICRKYLSDKTAFHTMLAMNSILLFNAGGLLATADAIQSLGWTGACYHIMRAYDENRLKDWIFGGLWFGFAMLSKYSGVLFGLFAFSFGLMNREKRKLLWSYKPYLGAILSVIVFIPVLYWNQENGWASARHVLYLGGGKTKALFNIKYFFDYLGGQMAVLSPIIFVFICTAWIKALKQDKWFYKYLFFTSALMAGFFGLLSLHSRIYANWPAPAYAGGIILAAHFYCDNREKFLGIEKRKIWFAGIIFSFITTSILLIQLNYRVLPLNADLDRISREISGWKEAGIVVKDAMDSMPQKDKSFYFAAKYQTASELAFYTPGQPFPASINRWSRPNVYDFWFFDEDLIGQDGVGLLLRKSRIKKLEEVFQRVELYRELDVKRDGLFVRKLYIVKCFGFKGGLRWKPKDGSDIRYEGPKKKIK